MRTPALTVSFPKKPSSRTVEFWEQVLLLAAYVQGTFELHRAETQIG